MQKTVIGLLTKSPWPQGRVGSRENQDWYQQCLIAALMLHGIPKSEVVVTSATHVSGAEREEQYYVGAMAALGIAATTCGEGMETVAQLDVFKRIASDKSAKLILVVTWPHYIRARWICRRHRIDAEIMVAYGIPRPKELITDVILTFLYPALDICGLEKWFMKKVRARRASGKL